MPRRADRSNGVTFYLSANLKKNGSRNLLAEGRQGVCYGLARFHGVRHDLGDSCSVHHHVGSSLQDL